MVAMRQRRAEMQSEDVDDSLFLTNRCINPMHACQKSGAELLRNFHFLARSGSPDGFSRGRCSSSLFIEIAAHNTPVHNGMRKNESRLYCKDSIGDPKKELRIARKLAPEIKRCLSTVIASVYALTSTASTAKLSFFALV